MKRFFPLFLFFIFLSISVNAYSQCTGCTITNPASLPNPIPAGTVICITSNQTYGGGANLTGGTIKVCSGANLRINGAVSLSVGSQITTNGCSSVEVNGNVQNNSPNGLMIIDNCNCPGAFDVSGPIFGFGIICGPLPIELISFDVKLINNNEVSLNWSTATEINNSHFIIERSVDLMNWDLVSTVQGAGNSNEIKTYSENDILDEKGTYYYKLTQVDYDGMSETFDYKTVTCDMVPSAVSANIFPNPAFETITLSLNGTPEADINVDIISLSGQVVQSSVLSKSAGREHKTDVSAITPGVYLIRLQNFSLHQTTRLIIQ